MGKYVCCLVRLDFYVMYILILCLWKSMVDGKDFYVDIIGICLIEYKGK